eukprot:1810812-Amphidinium_carterae.1
MMKTPTTVDEECTKQGGRHSVRCLKHTQVQEQGTNTQVENHKLFKQARNPGGQNHTGPHALHVGIKQVTVQSSQHPSNTGKKDEPRRQGQRHQVGGHHQEAKQ